MITVRFTTLLLSDLNNYLIDGSGIERMCYLFGYAHKSKNGNLTILPKKIICPDMQAISATPVSVRLDKDVRGFIYRAFGESDFDVIINCHSHPFDSSDSVMFSSIDDNSDKEEYNYLFNEIVKIKEENNQNTKFHFLSYLKGVNSLAVRQTNKIGFNYHIDIHEIGSRFIAHNNSRYIKNKLFFNNKSDTKYDRQIRAFGIEGQRKLNKLKVTVVGAGGTGAIVCEGLVRLGIKNITIIDYDKIEKSNLNRLQGTSYKDVHKFKADVIAKKLKNYDKDVRIQVCKQDIKDDSAIDYLVQSNIIFGCTDNAESRYILNKISSAYLIPIFDVGVSLSNFNKEQIKATWRYTAVIPQITPCFDCSPVRIYDKDIVERRLFHKSNYNNLVKAGYIKEAPEETSPAVYHLNQHAVSKLLFEFHNYISDFKPLIWHVYGDMAKFIDPENYACEEYSEKNLEAISNNCFTCQVLLATGNKYQLDFSNNQ